MAKNKKPFPVITLSAKRGGVTVSEVLAAPPGTERDEMIRKWCASVWNVYADVREVIIEYVKENCRINIS